MAFSIRITTDGDRCAICRKHSTVEHPLIDMCVTGRSWSDRNYVAAHEDCLLKAISKIKTPKEATV